MRVNVALAQGNTDEALEYARRAVALSRARGEPAWLAWSLSESALTHAMRGDAAAALPDVEEVVALRSRLPRTSVSRGIVGLAAVALGDSEPERALALAREAVEGLGPGERSMAWAMAGHLAAQQGNEGEALQYMARAIEDLQWLGNRVGMGAVIRRLADLFAESDPEATAVLQGAGDALVPGYAHTPHTLKAREQAIATLDASIGAARRHELHQQGNAMTDDEAVAYANAAINRRLQGETS
jgi:tetratricopeptide (TPR) repeat protein